jgi:tRNA (cmo5U34)-methyltransferase
MAQFHFDPATYPDLMRAEVPLYGRLQDELARAAAGGGVRTILDLGTGTGETARRVLDAHPEATLLGLDLSPAMLAEAARALAGRPVELRVGRLEDPLPAGPFDLAVSALAVHHLPGAAKGDLFARVAAALRPGGRFVLADVVVPADPATAATPIHPGYDHPSPVPDQLAWLAAAGFTASVAWSAGDLAVLTGDRLDDPSESEPT